MWCNASRLFFLFNFRLIVSKTYLLTVLTTFRLSDTQIKFCLIVDKIQKKLKWISPGIFFSAEILEEKFIQSEARQLWNRGGEKYVISNHFMATFRAVYGNILGRFKNLPSNFVTLQFQYENFEELDCNFCIRLPRG